MPRYLTMNELRERLGNRSRASIYRDLEAGRLPRPFRLGGRLYWDEGYLIAHLTALQDAAEAEEGGLRR